MAGTTTTTVDQILKEFYMGPLRENITKGLVLWNRLQKNREDVSGRRAVIPINYSRNVGIGSAAEGTTLPTAGNQKYLDAVYTLKYLYGRLQITGQTIRLTKNDAGAFARALDREISGLQRDFRNELNRILNGPATNGLAVNVLTTIVGTVTNATQTVVSTRFLYEDELLSAGAAVTPVQILSINSDTSITFTASYTGTAGDVLIKRGADEATGIGTIIDSTGIIGGIDPTSKFWWQSVKLANAGTPRALTLALLQSLYTEIEKRQNDGPDFLFAKHVQRDKYLALLVQNQRYVGSMNSADAGGGSVAGEGDGKTTLAYNDIPFVVDKDATDGTIYAIEQENLIIFEAGDMDFMDMDGAILSRVVGVDAYEATWFYYFQQGTDNRRVEGKLIDLIDP